jgi:hypothetical protein
VRAYASVSPQFWIGRTGKALRGNADAQILALYLMTSPHANMIGVFHCPLVYVAHETGLTFEGASKALQSLIEAGFCTYDHDDEYVFVHEFAAHQVGEGLSAKDNRCKGVLSELSKVPKNQCRQAFTERYRDDFHLFDEAENTRGIEAPSKPLRSQEQEQEQEERGKPLVASPAVAGPSPVRQAMPACPSARLVDLYHERLPELPRVRLMTDARSKALQRRWRWVLTSRREDGQPRACDAGQAVDWFDRFFERARSSDFLMGRGGRGAGHEGWQCDLDFLLSDKGLKLVVEKTAVAA